MEAKITGAVRLTEKAQAALQRQKRAQRVNNEHYFRVHPELRTMISAFISSLLKDKPEDVHEYAERFFTNPELAHSLGLPPISRARRARSGPHPGAQNLHSGALTTW